MRTRAKWWNNGAASARRESESQMEGGSRRALAHRKVHVRHNATTFSAGVCLCMCTPGVGIIVVVGAAAM